MAITLKAITSVFNAGLIVKPGEIFSAEDSFAKKLIDGGSAKVNNAVETKKADDPHAELRTKFMALKVDELKQLAIDNKVELTAEDNRKDEITQKLIEAGVIIDEKENL